jgi:hypothetical protein
MARQTSIETRLGRIESTLERAIEDRAETSHKIDMLDQKFDASLIANGEIAGALKGLSQSVESSARTITDLSAAVSKDDCGRRLNAVESWMEKVEKRIRELEPARPLSKEDEARLADCVRGVKEYRDGKESRGKKIWQIVIAALGSGSVGALIAKAFGH